MLHPVSGVLCVEGEQTGDGRFIVQGALTWAGLPLPLAWIVEGDQHVDMIAAAPQVGTIDTIARVANLVGFEGVIDDEIPEGAEILRRLEAGSAPLGVRFPVSIDPDDYEVELVDTNPAEDEEAMVLMVASGQGALPAFRAAAGDTDAGGEVIMTDSSDSIIQRYTRLRIRGATCCSVAAFDGAYLELATAEAEAPAGDAPAEPATVTVTVTAAADEADEPCAECDESLVAAGGPVLPPADWFEDPAFQPGDGRMVRQPDGQWLCPLTVTADGRVFGHMFGWRSCHTGFTDVCQLPPQSPSGYAYYNRRPIPCDGGDTVHVGVLSMGCGHADLKLNWQAAQAHYDGGPGAVQMADVHVGADEWGAWFSGALRPDVTPEQVRAFTACSVSGDWREVQRGRGLDLVACLAGVTVPGFIVTGITASALIAAASVAGTIPSEPSARYVDGAPVALVAAGVVRQPMPWERALGILSAEVEELRGRVRQTELVTDQFRGDAITRLVAATEAVQTNGH
jgi:hypothetical protein